MRTPAERLREARRKAKFATVADGARRVGENENTYKSIENGTRGLTTDNALTFARAFNTTPEWLVWERGPGPGETAAKADGFDPEVLEIAIAVALEHRSRSGPAQIARAARIFYGYLIEAKARGEVVNNETAAQILLDKLAERGDI